MAHKQPLLKQTFTKIFNTVSIVLQRRCFFFIYHQQRATFSIRLKYDSKAKQLSPIRNNLLLFLFCYINKFQYFCTMIRISIFFFLLLSTCVKTFAEKKTVDFRIIHTTDIHGHFFPYDYINRKPLSGSVARIASYVDSLRNIYSNKLLLLDSGEIGRAHV